LPRSASPSPAVIDRLVLSSVAVEDQAGPERISALAEKSQWILLGEPGSGKSTTFNQAARAESARAITARDFVEGEKPRGKTLFIDAVEEYRIGEAGHDRLDQLVRAIKRSPYKRWRLTCRTLTPADLKLIERTLGTFETWQLAPLDDPQQEAVLKSLGAPNPAAVMQRVEDLAAGSLMGNPATLKLLYQTLHTATQPIESRGDLFSHATGAMAAGMNEDLPERPDRSTPGAIVTAAEKASTVLMLSAREHLWMLGTNPPQDGMVVRDDLLPAEVDIQALKDAVDTAMFRGEAGRYIPTHRMVAEYLAGRSLAAAVSGIDGAPAALTYGRAYALLCGADDSPAPALMGVFAWFVTCLAHGPHRERALALVVAYPEAILFQGDPAMLPPAHRQALLDATGRGDPWFLVQGATAVGGLAGPDMEMRFRAILNDAKETPHRRGMVLDAIAAGRRMPGLDADVERIVADPLFPEWLRRRAIQTVVARVPNPTDALRRIVTQMASEVPKTAMTVKLQALTRLVGVDVTTAEAHAALKAYARTGDGVMGYSRAFAYALEQNPPVDFFESSIDVRKQVGQSRSYEVANSIERILAAVIRSQPKAKAEDILRWLANAGFEEDEDPHEAVRYAIRDWVKLRPARAGKLFWALFKQSPDRAYHAPLAWSRLVGGEVPPKVVAEVFKRVKAQKPSRKANQLAWLAYQLFGRFDAANTVYWRLWKILKPRPDLAEVFEALTFVPMNNWQVKQGRDKVERAARRDARTDRDREWMSANIDKLRSGVAVHELEIAATHYSGHTDEGHGYGRERLVRWVGEEITEAITEGWTIVMSNFPQSWREQAEDEAKGSVAYANFLAAAWAEDRITRGLELGPLSLNAGFALLRGYYLLTGEHRDAVEIAGAERIGRDAAGRKALLSYWDTVIAAKPHDLPHSNVVMALKDGGAVIKAFLKAHPDAKEPVLRTALGLAARSLPAADLTLLVEDALRRPTLPEEAQVLWRFVGFLLDPARYEADFASDLKSAGVKTLLDRVNHGHLIYGFDTLTASAIVRDRAIVQHLGPHYKPSDSRDGSRDDMSQVVAGALKTIAETPTLEASSALAALAAAPGLKAWKDLLNHHTERQRKARLQAMFTAPLPKVVAKALLAGPPATPADLRAVVREVLEDLAYRLQNDDTSGWQGFWNYPRDPEKQWPKIENDCRDLLLDRLRDRMFRFGVAATHAFPEAQRRNNRRADILLIGEGAASLPIEAKRHLHDEIWTAGAEQLPDYGRAPGTEGHGIYLVFWFGTEVGPVPNRPKGQKAIATAEALQAALRDRQPDALKPLIDIIVVDVTPPAGKRLERKPKPKPPAKAAKPAKPAAASSAAKPAGRSRKAPAKGGSGPSA